MQLQCRVCMSNAGHFMVPWYVWHLLGFSACRIWKQINSSFVLCLSNVRRFAPKVWEPWIRMTSYKPTAGWSKCKKAFPHTPRPLSVLPIQMCRTQTTTNVNNKEVAHGFGQAARASVKIMMIVIVKILMMMVIVMLMLMMRVRALWHLATRRCMTSACLQG